MLHWEVWVRRKESCNEVILEGDDEPLRCVVSVHAWRDQLLVRALLLQ